MPDVVQRGQKLGRCAPTRCKDGTSITDVADEKRGQTLCAGMLVHQGSRQVSSDRWNIACMVVFGGRQSRDRRERALDRRGRVSERSGLPCWALVLPSNGAFNVCRKHQTTALRKGSRKTSFVPSRYPPSAHAFPYTELFGIEALHFQCPAPRRVGLAAVFTVSMLEPA